MIKNYTSWNDLKLKFDNGFAQYKNVEKVENVKKERVFFLHAVKGCASSTFHRKDKNQFFEIFNISTLTKPYVKTVMMISWLQIIIMTNVFKIIFNVFLDFMALKNLKIEMNRISNAL